MAGEFGHISVEPNGAVCNCGNRGCLEAVASGLAVMKEAKGLIHEKKEHPLYGKLDSLTIRELLLTGETGDPLIVSIINKAAARMGTALASVINLLDPSVIILGGILALGYLPYMDIVRDTALKRRLPGARETLIVRSACGDTAGVIGAGVLVANDFYENRLGELLEKTPPQASRTACGTPEGEAPAHGR